MPATASRTFGRIGTNSVAMAEGEGSGTAGAFSETQVKAMQAIFQQMLDDHLEAREAGTAGKEGKTGEGEASGSVGKHWRSGIG